jgi:Insulin-like growth factor binding protein
MTSPQHTLIVMSRLVIFLLPLVVDASTYRAGHQRRVTTAAAAAATAADDADDASAAIHHHDSGTAVATADNAPIDLRCPPCDRIHCWPRRASRLRCPGGIVRGVCDCCPVCARIEGQSCGGRWNYLGRCDAGLHCSATAVDADDGNGGGRSTNRVYGKDQSTVNQDKQRSANAVWKPAGICLQGWSACEFTLDSNRDQCL